MEHQTTRIERHFKKLVYNLQKGCECQGKTEALLQIEETCQLNIIYDSKWNSSAIRKSLG